MIAIDPGSEYSAFVVCDEFRDPLLPEKFGKVKNEELMELLVDHQFPMIVCEFPVPRGQLASKHLFETVYYIGRFHQLSGGSFRRIDRKDVKMELCGVANAKDNQIRQALIDRYGGESIAIGGHKCPVCGGRKGSGRGKERKPCQDCGATGKTPTGPLYGISSDVWQALGVAVTWNEQQKRSMK